MSDEPRSVPTPDRAAAYEPRYGMEDIFQDGARGQFLVKFEF